MYIQNNPVVEDHELKHARLVFELAITANATPASKAMSSDLPGVCLLATQGIDGISATEVISGLANFASATDSTGVFQVMLSGAQLVAKIGSIRDVMKVDVHGVNFSNGLTTAPTVTMLGTSWGLTPGGNIAFQVATGTSLATTSQTFCIVVDYMVSR